MTRPTPDERCFARRPTLTHNAKATLLEIYNRLYDEFGPQGWWPAKSPFEVMVGAILTQNTAWTNVEKAIKNLKKQKLLSPEKIKKVPIKKLAKAVRSSGFYNEKAKKLKSLVKFLGQNGKSINKLRALDITTLRERLLAVKGIGKETADSVILYALDKPIFVVDAYTKRIFERRGLIEKDASYDEIQRFFMNSLPAKTKLFNEYHALIVRTGKEYCKRRKPLCKKCPLR